MQLLLLSSVAFIDEFPCILTLPYDSNSFIVPSLSQNNVASDRGDKYPNVQNNTSCCGIDNVVLFGLSASFGHNISYTTPSSINILHCVSI